VRIVVTTAGGPISDVHEPRCSESSSASVCVEAARPDLRSLLPSYVIAQPPGCGWSTRGLPSIGTPKKTSAVGDPVDIEADEMEEHLRGLGYLE
jgi:hypothetical protein